MRSHKKLVNRLLAIMLAICSSFVYSSVSWAWDPRTKTCEISRGCSIYVDKDSRCEALTSWDGACRAGLLDGPGMIKIVDPDTRMLKAIHLGNFHAGRTTIVVAHSGDNWLQSNTDADYKVELIQWNDPSAATTVMCRVDGTAASGTAPESLCRQGFELVGSKGMSRSVWWDPPRYSRGSDSASDFLDDAKSIGGGAKARF